MLNLFFVIIRLSFCFSFAIGKSGFIVFWEGGSLLFDGNMGIPGYLVVYVEIHKKVFTVHSIQKSDVCLEVIFGGTVINLTW